MRKLSNFSWVGSGNLDSAKLGDCVKIYGSSTAWIFTVVWTQVCSTCIYPETLKNKGVLARGSLLMIMAGSLRGNPQLQDVFPFPTSMHEPSHRPKQVLRLSRKNTSEKNPPWEAEEEKWSFWIKVKTNLFLLYNHIVFCHQVNEFRKVHFLKF